MKSILLLLVVLLLFSLPALSQEAEVIGEDEAEEVLVTEEYPNSTATVRYKEKNPALAALLSVIIPGGGQYYNGQIGKGIAFTATYLVSGTMGMVFLASTILDLDDNSDTYGGLALGCMFICLGSYIWSIVDAPMSANEINKRNKLLSWDIGDGASLSLKPDIRASSLSFNGQKAFSPSYGAKICFTF